MLDWPKKPVLYDDYLKFLQENEAKLDQEFILILTHKQCITLGKNSNENEILQQDIKIYKSTRGGGATYHDEGQLIIYPHINLKKHGLNIADYIMLLENWGKDALKECGVQAGAGIGPGLWINQDNMNYKVAFIGIAVKHGCTQHGISFNLDDCKIENFKKIIACKSFEKIAKINVGLNEFAKAVVKTNPFANEDIKIHNLIEEI